MSGEAIAQIVSTFITGLFSIGVVVLASKLSGSRRPSDEVVTPTPPTTTPPLPPPVRPKGPVSVTLSEPAARRLVTYEGEDIETVVFRAQRCHRKVGIGVGYMIVSFCVVIFAGATCFGEQSPKAMAEATQALALFGIFGFLFGYLYFTTAFVLGNQGQPKAPGE